MKVNLTFLEISVGDARKLIETAEVRVDGPDGGIKTENIMPEPAPEAPKAKRKAKAKAKPVVAEEDTDDQMDMDFEGVEDEDEGEEAPKATLEDVTKELKAYAKKNGREAAIKVLKKFKVKFAADLDADEYEKFLEALK